METNIMITNCIWVTRFMFLHDILFHTRVDCKHIHVQPIDIDIKELPQNKWQFHKLWSSVQETKVSLNPLASNEWVRWAKEGKKNMLHYFLCFKNCFSTLLGFPACEELWWDMWCQLTSFRNVCNCKIQSEIEGFDVFVGRFTSLLCCLDDLAFGEDLYNQWFLVKLLNPLDLKVSSPFSSVLRSWKNKQCVYNPKQDVLHVSLTSCCVGWYGRHN